MDVLLMLAVLALALCLIFWLLATYVVPAMPEPFGKVFLAICALIAVVLILYVISGQPLNIRWPR